MKEWIKYTVDATELSWEEIMSVLGNRKHMIKMTLNIHNTVAIMHIIFFLDTQVETEC